MSSEKENIKNLVIEARKGNADKFGELYEIFSKEMYNYAYYYLGDSYLAEDAVSETVCDAFLSVKSLKKPESFKSWIFTILVRKCKKQLNFVINMRETDDIDSAIGIKDEGLQVEEKVELKDALSLLNESDREIVLLSKISGYNSKEIGKMLGIPEGTIRSRLSRAMEKLVKNYSEVKK